MNANNPALDCAVEMMIESYKGGGKLLVCGNGGSAADSAHIVGELVKGFMKKRPLPAEWDDALDHAPLQMGLPAIDLTAQGAVIAAVVNDLSGECMYAQQVMAYCNPGDVILGITTSGNAKNVILALRAAKLRGATHTKKIGHSGTLDPMATGVLPLFFGGATKVCSVLQNEYKRYVAEIKFGITTDTEDTTGTVLTQQEVSITEEQIEAVLPKFRGDILQVPPMYSALKVNGQKLYDLARKGKEVPREPRPITISELTFLGFEDKNLLLRVQCSKGTYIRTLCKDIGQALGCGGCMGRLRRIRAGEYTLKDAVPLETLLNAEHPEQYLLPVDSMFSNYPAVKLTPNQEKRCRNGNAFSVSLAPGTYRAYSQNGEFLMLARVEQGTMTTVKSFFEPE